MGQEERSEEDAAPAGHVVYLHGTAGAGRSPTLTIAYLHWFRGWDLDTAVAYVKAHRLCSPDVEAIRLAIWDDLNGQTEPESGLHNRTC